MRIKHIIGLVICFIFTTSIFFLEAKSRDNRLVKSAATIQINQRQHVLKYPLIKRQQTQFIALEDLKTILDGKLTEKKKYLSHELTWPRFQARFIFLENGREWWVNDKRHFFSKKLFSEKGQLYIPLKTFCAFSGITLTSTQNKPRLQFQKQKIRTQLRSRLSFTHPQHVKEVSLPKATLDAVAKIPNLKGKKKIRLQVQDRIQPLGRFFYDQDILYVDAETLFTKLGLKVTSNKTTLSIYKEGLVILFSLKNAGIQIQKSKQKSNLYLQGIAKAKVKKGRIFVPLENVVSAFDYDLDWHALSKTISLKSKLLGFYWAKQGAFPVLKLLTSDRIELSEAKEGILKEGYYITLPQSTSVVSKTFQKSPHPFLKWTAISHKKNDVEVFLRAGLGSVPPTILSTQWGAECRFHSILLSIKEQVNKKTVTIKIQGTKPFSYQSQILKKQKKLVLDFPNTYSELPAILRSKQGIYQQVRMSQYKLNPPVTRMVFDLNKLDKQSWRIKQHKNSLSITFPVIKKRALTTRKATKKTAAKKIAKTLKGKVIVVDAGHGGRDPGAITKSREFEKRFTLDVALDVKRKLEAKGAIVVLTRSKDRSTSLPRRIRIANRKRADIFISIHFNSNRNKRVNGTETYYFKSKDKKLARALHKEITKNLKLKNNGLRRARLYVLRHSKMPSVLLEPAYMTDKSNFQKIKSPYFRKQLANSVVKGVENYFKR